MKTRLLALLLAGAVTASLLGVSALAAEEDEPETGTTQTQGEETPEEGSQDGEPQEGEEPEDGQEAGGGEPEEEYIPTRWAPSPLKIWSAGCGRTT